MLTGCSRLSTTPLFSATIYATRSKYSYIGPSSSLKRMLPCLSPSPAPLVSLIAGILILIVPRLLNYIVGIYLIIIGPLGLFGASNLHLR